MSSSSNSTNFVTVALFGATGVTGLLLLRVLLSRGYRVRAFTRSPSKIPADLSGSDQLTVIVGELTDADKLRETVVGTDAVVNMLGPYAGHHPAGTPITKGMEIVVKLMDEFGIKRYIALSTCALPHHTDRLNAVTLLISNVAVRIFDRDCWAEFVAMGYLVFERPHLNWTLLRVGLMVGSSLSDDPSKGNVGPPGDGITRMWIRREQIVWRTVEALEKGAWIREMPYISA